MSPEYYVDPFPKSYSPEDWAKVLESLGYSPNEFKSDDSSDVAFINGVRMAAGHKLIQNQNPEDHSSHREKDMTGGDGY